VGEGVETVYPGNFVRKLATLNVKLPNGSTGKLKLSADRLGSCFVRIGLPFLGRKAGGMVYRLPPPEFLEDWLAGEWYPLPSNAA